MVHAPVAFPHKDPPYSLSRKLGGPQSLSERLGEEKILSLTEIGPRFIIIIIIIIIII